MREVTPEEGETLSFFLYEELFAFRCAAEAAGLSAAEVEDVFISNDVLGIRMTGIAAKIRDTYLHTGKGGGVRIEVGGGDTTQIIDGVLIGAQNAPQPFAGIMVRHSSALTISNTSVLTSGFGLLINPGNGQLVSSLIARDCYFDNGRKGVFITPEAGGNVARVSLRGCWVGSSSEAGTSITSNGAGICEGISIDGCDIVLNGGPAIEIANTRGVQISDNKISANPHGIWIATGVRNFTIRDNLIGQNNGEPANTGWAVVLDASADVYQIVNNNMVGNGAGKILGFSPSPYRVENNNIG
jgi:parallel beta-helix repeat protein